MAEEQEALFEGVSTSRTAGCTRPGTGPASVRTLRRGGGKLPGRARHLRCPRRLLWGLALCLAVLPALPAGAQGRRGAAPVPPPRPAARELAVTNHTDTPLREFYLQPTGSGGAAPAAPGRGEDLLGEDLLAPEATRRLRLPGRGCGFDVVAVFADDREDTRQNLDLCRGGRLALGDPAIPRRAVTVGNHAGRPLAELYAQPSGRVPREVPGAAPHGAAPGSTVRGSTVPGAGDEDDDAVAPDPWGIDRLEDTPLTDGGTRRLMLRVPDCRVDLRAVYEDDAAEEKRDVDVCHEPRVRFDGSGIPRPPDVPFTLVNRHAAPIAEFYASAATDSDWGPNRLAAPLDRGGQQRLTAAVDCVADLRAVFPNGAAEERREVDLCATGVVVLRPGWTVAARLDEGAPDLPPPRPGSLRLRNRGSVPVVQLYLGAPGAAPDAAPGPDRLGRNVLGAGETLDLQPPEPGACAASLRAVFRDGTEIRRDPIDLCSGTEVPLP